MKSSFRSAEVQHTIEVLLDNMDTQDWAIASARLNQLTELDFSESPIKNLEPLSNFTNLTSLCLQGNQINPLNTISRVGKTLPTVSVASVRKSWKSVNVVKVGFKEIILTALF